MEGDVVLQARLLPDPPLWVWEVVDRDGRLVESGWNRDWSAYDDADAALLAGRAFLAGQRSRAARSAA